VASRFRTIRGWGPVRVPPRASICDGPPYNKVKAHEAVFRALDTWSSLNHDCGGRNEGTAMDLRAQPQSLALNRFCRF
jgi:hypothetical protein